LFPPQASLTPSKRVEEACQKLGTPAAKNLPTEIQEISRKLQEPTEVQKIMWQLMDKVG
jgi:hypothetical protein